MPPNAKGGKGYKKGKHGDGGEVKMIEILDDQMLGRVLKAMGNRRFKVYCNDNRERICKICGSMRKSEWISEGTVVIISLREIGMRIIGGQGDDGIGDILGIVDRSLYNKLKRDPNINPAIFTNIENQDMNDVKRRVKNGTLEEDEYFVFERDEEDEDNDEDDESDDEMTSEERKKARLADRERKSKAADQKLKSQRNAKTSGGVDRPRANSDNIDIDAL